MNGKYKIYLTLIISIAVFLIVVLAIIPFLLNKIILASSILIQKKQDLGALQKKEHDIVVLERDYQRIKPDLDKINKSLLDQAKILDFIVALEKVAQKTNIKCDIKIGNQQPGGNAKQKFKTMDFQVSLAGSFPNTIQFLKNLEAMPYLNEINIIQMQRMSQGRAEEKVAAGDIGANLNITVYLKP